MARTKSVARKTTGGITPGSTPHSAYLARKAERKQRERTRTQRSQKAKEAWTRRKAQRTARIRKPIDPKERRKQRSLAYNGQAFCCKSAYKTRRKGNRRCK